VEIKKLETRYYKANANDCTHIKAEVYYSIGGMNYFTYKQEQRGYYISISPVTRERGMESYTAFSGSKACCLPAKRQSAKQAETAKAIFDRDCQKLIENLFPGYVTDWEYERR